MKPLFVILLFIALVFLFLKRRRSKWNPIDNIHFGGTMGFLLGDKYEFCLSRLKHLNIPIDSNDYDDENKLMTESRWGYDVTFGKDFYNNIKEVRFSFKDKILESIAIEIDYSEYGIKDMYGILVSRLSKVLGKDPKLCTNDFAKWPSRKGDITLSIFNFDLSKTEILSIQILRH